MLSSKLSWRPEVDCWSPDVSDEKAQLVLYFGDRVLLAEGRRYQELRARFPRAHIVGCSTGGQIAGDDIENNCVCAVAIRFETAEVEMAAVSVEQASDSRACGASLALKLARPGLAAVFVLSDGLNVNGSELVAGLSSIIGKHIPVNGGLAGDGADFRETLVGANCNPKARMVAALGFYGESIRVGHGSAGGWDVFGPRRRITRSRGNILYQLDGAPALDLYEKYLGDEASGLPGTGLLFPLRVFDPANPDHDIVRTILAVDRQERSMTFAGDMPEGWIAQLMRGSHDRLVAGAADAARQARIPDHSPVAILVSCIGRRLLMGQRVHEEIEAAVGELGSHSTALGFYSYGEISPHDDTRVSELHNQTMTVFTIAEAAA